MYLQQIRNATIFILWCKKIFNLFYNHTVCGMGSIRCAY